MIRKLSVGATYIRSFPKINDGYGLFGQKGLVLRNYRVNVMYRNTHFGTGTYFSAKSLNKGGSLFRIDKGYIHNSSIIKPHSTIRFYYKGLKYGNTKQRYWYPTSIRAPFFEEINITKLNK